MSDVKKQYIKYLDSPEGADKYNKFKKILYGKNDTLVLKLFGIIFPKFKGRKDISILDVGGGDGKRLMHMMELFEGKNIQTKAVLVEPSKTFTENCKKDIKRLALDVRVLKNKFEDFSTTEKFDLIVFIHSIYTFSDSVYLKKAKSMLAKNGLLVIVANGENSFLGGLKKITDEQYGTSRNEIDSIVKNLEKYGFANEIKKFDTKFMGFVKGNSLDADGRLVFEWIAMRKSADIPAATRKKVVEYVSNKIKHGYIKEREVVILIEK